MMLIAVLGVVGFGGGFVRRSVVATAFLYTWAFCWAVVATIATAFALSDSFHNLSRLGLGGCSRARFWFEVARSSCILGAVLALISFLFMLVGLPEWTSFGNLLLPAIAFSICTFFVASTLGYLRLLVSRQRISGRATQCVGFFYPFCLAAIAMAAFLYLSRSIFDDPLFALATLVVICLVGALALTLVNRSKRECSVNAENAR